MARLPLIVGFGGVNAAGRSSFHHGYRRMVIDALPAATAERTLKSLAALMGRPGAEQDEAGRRYLLDHTLILYGSNMSNSNAHDHYPLPTSLIGGGWGRHRGGQHLKYPDHTPLANVLLTMLQMADVPIESFGDSTGVIAEA